MFLISSIYSTDVHLIICIWVFEAFLDIRVCFERVQMNYIKCCNISWDVMIYRRFAQIAKWPNLQNRVYALIIKILPPEVLENVDYTIYDSIIIRLYYSWNKFKHSKSFNMFITKTFTTPKLNIICEIF